MNDPLLARMCQFFFTVFCGDNVAWLRMRSVGRAGRREHGQITRGGRSALEIIQPAAGMNFYGLGLCNNIQE